MFDQLHNAELVLVKNSKTGLDKLEDIDMSENKLPKIENNIFDFLPKLKNLNIRQNKIKSIDDGAFDALVDLIFIDLGILISIFTKWFNLFWP